ncbi:mif2/CENP-C like domain-containing protein [Trichoderma breve]|uniref:CENP-C homolog n=1 Tax=Trichoderma breve TaxID=2034170 RepID=A0A9W9E471_9HYPO|nr:mif2/CENP-C like domain-containing protein [Trichoderma breve]KAJ4857539.1 mif2/CENP-C like domain-containing protein [Trichoderma breve]
MPRGGGRRGDSSAEPEALHELGVRGRKTGAFLKDTGERDEHGMQPLDAIFSSPAVTRGDESGSEDMEISSSAGPGPRTVLKNRRSIEIANERSSSPTRNPSAEKAARRLNFASKAGNKAAKTNGKQKATALNGFSRHGDDSESEELDDVMGATGNRATIDAEESILMVDSIPNDSPRPTKKAAQRQYGDSSPQKKRGKQTKAPAQAKPKAAPRAPVREPSEELDAEEPEEEPEEEELGQEEEEEEEEELPSVKQKGRSNKESKRRVEAPSSSQTSKKRGPPRKSLREDTPEEAQEQSEEEPQEEDEDEEELVPRKKQKTTGPSKAQPKAKPSNKGKAPARGGIVVPTKGRPGRKPRDADAEDGDVGETSFAALQRGPPMPKSRGLVSMRKDLDSITQTRSGRHSYRPIQYWRGEQVVREDEEQADMFAKDRFVMPSIKEVVRVPEEEVSSRVAPSRGKGRPKPKKAVVEEDYEAWEINPGTVEGEIVIWETEHEEHPPADDEPVQVTDERIALSAKAVQTSEIRDATFRFAKTLTMPFMGAGVVDLPPGGEKRPKNSRKMHMVFFVHTGKVMVTINEAQFRISAGGMWFVPRGNYYSITNDYDNPSRVFFCQACEISPTQYEASQMSIAA